MMRLDYIHRKRKSGVTEIVLKIRGSTDHSIPRISSHSRRFPRKDIYIYIFAFWYNGKRSDLPKKKGGSPNIQFKYLDTKLTQSSSFNSIFL